MSFKKKNQILISFLFILIFTSIYFPPQNISVSFTSPDSDYSTTPKNSSFVVADIDDSNDFDYLDIYKRPAYEYGQYTYYYSIKGKSFVEYNMSYYLFATEFEQKYNNYMHLIEKKQTTIQLYKCNSSRQINETYSYEITSSIDTEQGFTAKIIDMTQIGEIFYITYTKEIYNLSFAICKWESGILAIDANTCQVLSSFKTIDPTNNESNFYRFTQINFEIDINGDIKAYGVGTNFFLGLNVSMIFFMNILDNNQDIIFFSEFVHKSIPQIQGNIRQVKRDGSNSYRISVIQTNPYTSYKVIKYNSLDYTTIDLYQFPFSEGQIFNIDYFDVELNCYFVFTTEDQYFIRKLSSVFDVVWDYNSYTGQNSSFKINWISMASDGNMLVAGDYIKNEIDEYYSSEDSIFHYNHVFVDLINPFGKFTGTLRFGQPYIRRVYSGYYEYNKSITLTLTNVYVCKSGELLLVGHSDFSYKKDDYFYYLNPLFEEFSAFGFFFSIKSLSGLSEGTIFQLVYYFIGIFGLMLLGVGVGLSYWRKKNPVK